MPLKERPYYTKITRKPSENEIRIIDNIANEYATNLKSDKTMLDYWDINVMLYTAAITLKNHLGDLKETKQEKITVTKPGWIRNLEQKIVSLRRKIAHTEVIIKCKQLNTFPTHQIKISTKLKRLFGNTKIRTLEYNLKILKQDLKATSKKLSYQSKLNEPKSINKKFSINPKNVYRKFRGGNIKIKKIPTGEEIETFWKDIWGKKSDFNPGTPWFETLKSEYCKNAKQKQYKITSETIDKVLKKLQNGKAPGTDLIVGFWYKNLMFYKADLVYIFQNTLKGHKELPSWLTRARTQLLPKNENTHIAKNYRPIACQNLMFKLYTS